MRLAFWILTLASVSACGGSDATRPPAVVDTFGGSPTALAVVVNMPSVVYTPNNVDIARGGVVSFVFTAVPHDVRFNGAANAPEDILATSNVTVTRSFPVAGTFAFLCTLHANMTGKVTVH